MYYCDTSDTRDPHKDVKGERAQRLKCRSRAGGGARRTRSRAPKPSVSHPFVRNADLWPQRCRAAIDTAPRV